MELLGPLLQATVSLLGAGVRTLLLLGQWVMCKALGQPHSPVSQLGLFFLYRTGGQAGVQISTQLPKFTHLWMAEPGLKLRCAKCQCECLVSWSWFTPSSEWHFIALGPPCTPASQPPPPLIGSLRTPTGPPGLPPFTACSRPWLQTLGTTHNSLSTALTIPARC